ncbi:hypothetical protein [Methylobacterium sp. yr596]|uniref:hypothetical protein n=1 Tax=Methylobacterium sp. yr596 TaxID=1761800 RepID=UPI0008E9C9B2|nr:hypothetical protein [Methylobacterium sp. yr596]SFF76635.1 hypothetical protein SAMN04487844_1476 [Methylobacterium sp. yr596]
MNLWRFVYVVLCSAATIIALWGLKWVITSRGDEFLNGWFAGMAFTLALLWLASKVSDEPILPAGRRRREPPSS